MDGKTVLETLEIKNKVKSLQAGKRLTQTFKPSRERKFNTKQCLLFELTPRPMSLFNNGYTSSHQRPRSLEEDKFNLRSRIYSQDRNISTTTVKKGLACTFTCWNFIKNGITGKQCDDDDTSIVQIALDEAKENSFEMRANETNIMVRYLNLSFCKKPNLPHPTTQGTPYDVGSEENPCQLDN